MESTHSFPKIMELNVGGVHYSVSLSTLTKLENTTLAMMFSGKWAAPCDRDGRYFIDRSFYDPFTFRDGKMFRYVLNYLRCPDRVGLPQSPGDLQQLKVEADYYQLKELSFHIEKLIQREHKVQYCKVSLFFFL